MAPTRAAGTWKPHSQVLTCQQGCMATSRQSTPPIHGFDSDLEAVHAEVPPRRRRLNGTSEADQQQAGPSRTRGQFQRSGEEFVEAEVLAPTRKQPFRRRASTDPLQPVPEDSELQPAPSLDWDGFGENDELDSTQPLNNTRAWSTRTLNSEPGALTNSVTDDISDISSDDDEEFVSPQSDRREAAAVSDAGQTGDETEVNTSSDSGSGSESETEPEVGTAREPGSGDSAPGDKMAEDAAAWRRKVNKALMEANEDVLPFKGKKVNLTCLNRLCTLAASLKKDLQLAELELSEDPVYTGENGKQAAATECRLRLTSFLVTAEADRVELEEQEAVHRSEAQAAAAAAATAAATAGQAAQIAARRPVITRRCNAATGELNRLEKLLREFVLSSPTSDEEVFCKAELLKSINDQFSSISLDAKEVSRLAMENQLLEEAVSLEDRVGDVRQASVTANDNLHKWRKEAGVWAEKKKRSAARTDLKLPTFSSAINAKTTIYEFEKEWLEYKAAMEYSKEEALKTLKLAIQQPAKADIINKIGRAHV